MKAPNEGVGCNKQEGLKVLSVWWKKKFSTPSRKSQTLKDTPQTQKVCVAPMNQSSTSERKKWQKPKQTKHYNLP
ncbi:hypothetical protein [Nostoc sp. TCL26-01]|uniref:hypothetical protein n=1 Tax=Nostoc sp. TCL26-01 TaxID=2576904 RepID=UPI0015BAB988|nr:hypothetical protein [Nostoc sp. TCL26-01]QLE59873.1 hypothetical protein FD725_31020 [Nostoc sp. TCL26-01]